jgi:dTDP-4-dehydrorhamnose 3,5-epimerase-like enzyme
MLRFKLINLEQVTKIGLKLSRHQTFEDDRGYLKVEAEIDLGQVDNVIIKESYSKPFVGRGLHFQSNISPQIKIIRVQNGKILDIVFDPSDPLQTVFGFYLGDIDAASVMIPSNFAHGFIALKPTNFTYTCFGKYSEKDETTFNVLEDISAIMNFEAVSLSNKDNSNKRIRVLSW